MIHSTLPSEQLLRPVRATVAEVDPNLPVFSVATIEELLAGMLAQRRFNVVLLTLFSSLALLLAALGLYGLLSYLVAQSTREIGLRMALGAQRCDVVGFVVRQAGSLVALGILLGLAVSLATSRFLQGLLFEIEPGDPATLLAISLVIAAVSMIACLLPIRRAIRLDPINALRYE